jgi:hypothetical protein
MGKQKNWSLFIVVYDAGLQGKVTGMFEPWQWALGTHYFSLQEIIYGQ